MNKNTEQSQEMQEIMARIRQLADLADDPEAFSQRRREIINDYIASMDPARACQHRSMQDKIESACAVSGTPGKSAMDLLQMMSDRMIAIDNFARALKVDD